MKRWIVVAAVLLLPMQALAAGELWGFAPSKGASSGFYAPLAVDMQDCESGMCPLPAVRKVVQPLRQTTREAVQVVRQQARTAAAVVHYRVAARPCVRQSRMRIRNRASIFQRRVRCNMARRQFIRRSFRRW